VIQLANPRQGLVYGLCFPLALGRWAQVLEAAATTAISQYTGWSAALVTGHNQRLQFSQPMAPGPVQKPNPNPFSRQGSRHENHRIAAATNPLTFMAEVGDGQIAAKSNREIDHGDCAARLTPAEDAR
jgi:hypothetical protein